MQIETIVFPTDFSENSTVALGHATALASESGARLIIVHVQEPPPAIADTGFAGYSVAYDERMQQEAPRLLAEVVPDSNVEYVHRLVTGHPADEIVRLAESENADMIVMGTHGRRGVTRLLMGSVAESVVRRAPCPVLTLKIPAEAVADSGH